MKALQMMPVSLDALVLSKAEINLADIYITLGEYDQALEVFDRVLSIPSFLTVGMLVVDPLYEGLRKHPRFKKLVEKYP